MAGKAGRKADSMADSKAGSIADTKRTARGTAR